YEIVIRGYDKFFSIGEVSATKWPAIEENTKGPYEVTLKENGCILFAAALSPSRVVVASKHSLGSDTSPHAIVGRTWLLHHLQEAGRTESDLARILYEGKLTALCDDGFEEHILEYPPETRGLYLHGVNRNTAHLDTWSSEHVQQMAAAFGFHTTKYRTFDTAEEARSYCDTVRNQRSIYEGRPIEGFVVRCHRTSGECFFFKIKYDEPYLMYREWRELTRILICGKEPFARYEWTVPYLKWCRAELKRHPELIPEYQRNQGIIAMRNGFLQWWASQGRPELGARKLELTPVKHLVIIPIAVIGSGKTTLACALTALLNIAHVQNDNITVKRKRQAFNNALLDALRRGPAVIADRNNHQRDHRQSIAETVRAEYPDAYLLGLHFRLDDVKEQFRLCSGRVQARGENHQTLTPDRVPDFERVLMSFQRDFEAPNLSRPGDKELSVVLELDPRDPVDTNLRLVLQTVCPLLGVPLPDDVQIHQAAEAALGHKASTSTPPAGQPSHNAAQPQARTSGGKPRVPVYFGVNLPAKEVVNQLQAYFSQHPNEDGTLLHRLLALNRIPEDLHITLMHIAERKRHPRGEQLWQLYRGLENDATHRNDPVEAKVTHILWNEQLMALRVSSLQPDWVHTINQHPHITVGTASETIKPSLANALLTQVFSPTETAADTTVTSVKETACVPATAQSSASAAVDTASENDEQASQNEETGGTADDQEPSAGRKKDGSRKKQNKQQQGKPASTSMPTLSYAAIAAKTDATPRDAPKPASLPNSSPPPSSLGPVHVVTLAEPWCISGHIQAFYRN
ncbi:RNA ligase-domain-containing protein, partial [Thamnocephalis sphaerospora]